MKMNSATAWFYGSEGFGMSTSVPAVDKNELCQHGRRRANYTMPCPECDREAERQAFINAPWKEVGR